MTILETHINPLLDQFSQNWEAVSGEWISDLNEATLLSRLGSFLNENSIKSVVISAGIDSRIVDSIDANGLEVVANFGRRTYDRKDAISLCGRAEAGITRVDGLICDSGTLVMFSQYRGDRLCSSLPPIHLAVSINVPVYPDLSSFLETVSPQLSFTLVTGPSRTADIEKKLVLGAHGPKRVIVFHLAK